MIVYILDTFVFRELQFETSIKLFLTRSKIKTNKSKLSNVSVVLFQKCATTGFV